MILLGKKQIELGHFPDGTLRFTIPEELENDPLDITWKYDSDEELFALIALVQKLRSEGVEKVDLWMPYVPNARQDRVKRFVDVFTLKSFAGIINWLGFRTVRILDAHSNVTPALLDRVLEVSPEPLIRIAASKAAKAAPDSTGLIAFYPDEGAMKRYSSMLDLPYCFGMKQREWATGEIKDLKVCGDTELIRGSDVLIVDDICSRGGTFCWSAEKLKELGANHIYLYVTHCENTIFEGRVLTDGLIERVFTTDSILRRRSDKIEVTEV